MAKQTNLGNDHKTKLKITTPRGVKYVEKADMIIMRCIDRERAEEDRRAAEATILEEEE
mgnify:CR=1 FL=1